MPRIHRDQPAGPHDTPNLRVGVVELRRRVGNRQEIDREIDLGEVGTSTSSIREPGTVHLVLTMESLSDGVTVSGVVEVPWSGACRRCLEPTSGTTRIELAEVFKDSPDDGETYPIDGDSVDLGPAVHDSAVLALPLAPLCGEDCAGPDPDTFPVLSDVNTERRAVDPRWAALSELRFDAGTDDSLE